MIAEINSDRNPITTKHAKEITHSTQSRFNPCALALCFLKGEVKKGKETNAIMELLTA
jgi:hypothetical protein